MTEPFDASKIIEECRDEIREIRRELYGNPQLRQKGVYERLDVLEDHVGSLEKAKVENVRLERIETNVDDLKTDYRIALVYLKGIAWGGGAIMIPVIGAGLLALFRYLGGG